MTCAAHEAMTWTALVRCSVNSTWFTKFHLRVKCLPLTKKDKSRSRTTDIRVVKWWYNFTKCYKSTTIASCTRLLFIIFYLITVINGLISLNRKLLVIVNSFSTITLHNLNNMKIYLTSEIQHDNMHEAYVTSVCVIATTKTQHRVSSTINCGDNPHKS